MTILHFEGFRDTGIGRYGTSETGNSSQDSYVNYYTWGGRPTFNELDNSYGGSNGDENKSISMLMNGATLTNRSSNPIYTFLTVNMPSHIATGLYYATTLPRNVMETILSIGDIILYTKPLSYILGVGVRTSHTSISPLIEVNTRDMENNTMHIPGSWNHYELSVNKASQSAVARINGIEVINHAFTNQDALNSPNFSVSLLPPGFEYAYPEGTMDKIKRLSDWWITDGEFLGVCRVESLSPSETISSSWTSSSYTNLDVVSNLDTTLTFPYVESMTPNSEDIYSHHTSINPYVLNSIKAVRVTSSLEGQGGYGVRNLIKSGSSKSYGSNKNSQGRETVPIGNSSVFETNPSTGTSWTKNAVENLQFGYQLTNQRGWI